jgi:hypothetical protein
VLYVRLPNLDWRVLRALNTYEDASFLRCIAKPAPDQTWVEFGRI